MNVSKLFLGILPIALITATATSADAVSLHERVEIKEMKSGGNVVGMRIKLTLRPDGSGYQHVRIGLGPKGGDKSAGDAFRKKASDASQGFLLHQFPEVSGIEASKPKEMTFEVKFADVKDLKPGQEFEVISAWGGNPNNKDYYHVYGMTSPLASGTAYKVPGQAQQQQLAKRTRAPNKGARTSPKQKTSTLAKRLKANTAKSTSRKQGSTLAAKSNSKAPAKVKSSTRLAQTKTAAKATAKSSRGLSPAKVKSQSRGQATQPARAAKVKQAKAARAKKVKAKSKAR